MFQSGRLLNGENIDNKTDVERGSQSNKGSIHEHLFKKNLQKKTRIVVNNIRMGLKRYSLNN